MLSVCEDIWYSLASNEHLFDPLSALQPADFDLLVNLSASPYDHDKLHQRYTLFSDLQKRFGRPLLYVNQVGANDEIAI